jgi:hypothetical protein
MMTDSEVEMPRELALVTTLEGNRAWFSEKLILWPYDGWSLPCTEIA